VYISWTIKCLYDNPKDQAAADLRPRPHAYRHRLTYSKGDVFPLQALLWPRGWVEV